MVTGQAHRTGKLGRCFIVTNGGHEGSDDAQDLALWIREFGSYLLLVARSFEGDFMTAEDILQETWIVALRNVHARRKGTPARAWLHHVVLNVGRAAVRRASRRRKLMSIWGNAPSLETPPSIESEQVRQHLWRAIADLPHLQKQCLILRVVEGMSPADVAECLDRAPGTVKSSMHRAIRTLRKRLEHGNMVDFYFRDAFTSRPRKAE